MTIGILGSMEACDPTRSHESGPSARLHAAQSWRRTFRITLTCFALVAAITFLLVGLYA